MSRGFIENLLYLPDKTIEEVAEGISDTFNLGWQDQDIFQFHKLLNDGKAGYMEGTFEFGGNQEMSEEVREALTLPQNEWEKWARLSGDIAGLGASFFTGASMINMAATPMKYRKLVQTKPGVWEWQTDAAKIAAAGKKYPGLTGATHDYLNWIANNPLKAAQLDLLFSTGAATGLYTADRQLTDQFKEEHPFLTEIIKTGALVTGSIAAPVVVIGTSKGLIQGGIYLVKGAEKIPVAGMPVRAVHAGVNSTIKIGGNLLKKFLSLPNSAQQRDFIREEIKKNVDPKIVKQILAQWEVAMNDPASVIPKEVAMVTKQNIVSGDAVNALKTTLKNEGMNDAEISEKLFQMLSETTISKVDIGGTQYDVGVLAKASLEAYEQSLRNKGGMTEEQIFDAVSNARLQLSMAEQAPSQSMIKTQEAIEAGSQGERLSKILDRKNTNKNIVTTFYNSMFPTDANAPTVVIDTMTGKILQINRIGNQLEIAEQELKNLAASQDIIAMGGSDKVQFGQNLRTEYNTLKKNAQEPFIKEDALINEMGPNIEIANFKSFVDTLKTKIFGPSKKPSVFEDPDTLPPIIQKIIQVGESGTNPNLLDVWKLYTQITNQMFDAGVAKSAGMGGKEAYENLYLAQQSLFDFMENQMVKLGQRKLSQFFTDYKTKVADVFYRNAAFDMNRKVAGAGVYYTADEKVADLYLRNARDAEQFAIVYNSIKNADTKEKMLDGIRNVILDKVYQGSGVINSNGILNVRKLNTWMEKNSAWLDKFPKIKAELMNTNKLAEKIGNRIESLRSKAQNISASNVREKLKPLMDIVNSEIRVSAEGVPETIRGEVKENLIFTVNGLIKRALKDPVLMKRLRDVMKFQSGVPHGPVVDQQIAFRKMVWQNIGDNVGSDPGGVLNWMNSDAGSTVLNLIYTGSQKKALEKVLNAYQVLNTTPIPKGSADSAIPIVKKIQDAFGSSPQTITSIIRAWREGRISGKGAFMYLASRMTTALQKQKFKDLYYEAFSNPEIAEFLARDVNNVKGNGFGILEPLNKFEANRFQKWLWQNGISLPLEALTEPPLIISDPTEYNITIPAENEEPEIKDDQSSLAPMNMEIPDVVQASRLAAPPEMAETTAVETTPTGTIMEEDFASFFPHDTTGQMIAARRAAEGGIMSVNKHQRQRVL